MRNSLIVASLVFVLLLLAGLIAYTQGAWRTTPALPTFHPRVSDGNQLGLAIKPPKGSRSVRTDMDTRQLTSGRWSSGNACGFTSSFSLDIAQMDFTGLDDGRPELRAAIIGLYYADQIARAIPDATIEAGMPIPPPLNPQGDLHATYLVRHPQGYIIVSAGFAHRPSQPEIPIEATVDVHVISRAGAFSAGVTHYQPTHLPAPETP